MLTSAGIGQSFINSLTVTIPATIIPILIAAYRRLCAGLDEVSRAARCCSSLVVGLLVVPLQMSLIPLLRLYNDIGAVLRRAGKTYLGIWLAHTGFGLPLAIYLLRNYMAGLPREIMESARDRRRQRLRDLHHASCCRCRFPALASFAIFQFLWVWNDLLVAMVFLGAQNDQLVLTGRLVNLLGSRGGNWEILTASAFITIVVPLIVFFVAAALPRPRPAGRLGQG